MELGPEAVEGVEPSGVGLKRGEGAVRAAVEVAEGVLGAVAGLLVGGGPLGALAVAAGLGDNSAAEPPGGGEAVTEQGAVVAGGPVVAEPALALGLEGGGVLARQDDLLGVEVVLEAVEPGLRLVFWRLRPLDFAPFLRRAWPPLFSASRR